MKALIVIIVTAAIVTHLTVVAIVAASLALVPLALVVAWRLAVIRSGLGMRRGGRRRILSLGGKW